MNLDDLVTRDIKTMSQPSPQVEKIIADSLRKETGETNKANATTETPTQAGDSFKADSHSTGKVDSEGTIFDPTLHVVDASGNPKKTLRGTWRKKPGRGSPEKSSATGKGGVGQNVSRELGRTTAETIFFVCQSAFGDEWTPVFNAKMGIDERTQMIEAWAAYYEATGKTDVPPWVGVTIACGAYALPRLSQPKTRSRLGRYMDAIKQAISKRKESKKKESK